jgi:hypothetical protein
MGRANTKRSKPPLRRIMKNSLHKQLSRKRQIYFWKCLNWDDQEELNEIKCEMAELQDLIEIENDEKRTETNNSGAV